MNFSLLGSGGLIDSIWALLIIIALIAVVSFILIFIVDLILSITNRNASIFFRNKHKNNEDTSNIEANQVQFEHKDPKENTITFREDDELENEAPMRQTWDEAEAQKEEQQLFASNQSFDERSEEIENKKKQFEDFDSFDSSSSSSEDEEDYDFDAMIEEINRDAVTSFNAEKHKTDETIEETLPNVDDMFDDDKFEELFAEVQAEQKSKKGPVVKPKVVMEPDSGEEEPAPIVPTGPIVNVYGLFPEDALNQRLEKLKERLRVNERDLRGNRKEYAPLARVKRSLLRDQEKLRRKEATVARKKVLLYGVNNYADVDEGKAKQLSEDLELLDALRLSVKQCEEVMEQNKDRFPILEKANKILKEQNQQIKDDIAEVMYALEKYKNGNASDNE
ncbi:MAG: hypothetical protein IKQ31_02365 [Clostridia bacterium]|nr:hypothetical protein [Clostridia bacterium]